MQQEGFCACTHISALYKYVVQDLAPPWRAILTSPAVLAIIIGHFANNWGFYTLLTCLPTFLNQTLCLDISKVSQ